MKIRITITDLPGGMEIEKVSGGYFVRSFPDYTFTAGELAGIRDAINFMLQEEEPVPSRGASAVTGPWDRLDDIPSDVKVVIDKAGDRVFMDEIRKWSSETRARWNLNWAPYRLPEAGE